MMFWDHWTKMPVFISEVMFIVTCVILVIIKKWTVPQTSWQFTELCSVIHDGVVDVHDTWMSRSRRPIWATFM